jgi:hypothetical protein
VDDDGGDGDVLRVRPDDDVTRRAIRSGPVHADVLDAVERRRPSGVELLYPVVFGGLLVVDLLDGTPLPSFELAILLTLFGLLCAGLFVEGLLGSPAYAVLGGTLIVGVGALRAERTGGAWPLIWVAAGTAFALYGVRQWVLGRGGGEREGEGEGEDGDGDGVSGTGSGSGDDEGGRDDGNDDLRPGRPPRRPED